MYSFNQVTGFTKIKYANPTATLIIYIIIPHMTSLCKISIGRRVKILNSPCYNLDYHMRSIDARTVRFCKMFDFNDGTVKMHILSVVFVIRLKRTY